MRVKCSFNHFFVVNYKKTDLTKTKFSIKNGRIRVERIPVRSLKTIMITVNSDNVYCSPVSNEEAISQIHKLTGDRDISIEAIVKIR